jgi:streptogramin lyase
MRLTRCALMVFAFLMGATQLSWAKGLRIIEYPIPTPNAQAFGIAAEPDGNIWFTEGNGQKVARITPQGVITEFRPVPAHGAGYAGITTGPHNDIWFIIPSYFNLASLVVEMTTSGKLVSKHEILFSNGDVVHGPDGNLWVDLNDDTGVGRMMPDGTFTHFAATTQAVSITVGPDNNIWFTEVAGDPTSGLIGRVDQAGVVTEFKPQVDLADPTGIIGEPNGSLYFHDPVHKSMGRVDATTGMIKRVGNFAVCNFNEPPSHMWYWPVHSGGQEELESVNVFTGLVRDRYQFPQGKMGCPFALGSDGNLWFIDFNDNAIGVLKH